MKRSTAKVYVKLAGVNWLVIMAMYFVVTGFAIVFAQITNAFSAHEAFNLGVEQVTSNSQLLASAGALAAQTQSKVLALIVTAVLLVGLFASLWSYIIRRMLFSSAAPVSTPKVSVHFLPMVLVALCAVVLLFATRLLYTPTIPLLSLILIVLSVYLLNVFVFVPLTQVRLRGLFEMAAAHPIRIPLVTIMSLLGALVSVALIATLTQLVFPLLVVILFAALGPSLVHAYALLYLRRKI